MRYPIVMGSLLLAWVTATMPASAAGTVRVSFKPANDMTDAGRGVDGEHNLRTLGEVFDALGKRLPDGQTLSVEVLDVDLAGRVVTGRTGVDLRVLRGSADWPSLTLRWTLADAQRTLRQGEERISDMSYLMQPLNPFEERNPLPYETRLLERWFKARILAGEAP